MGQAQRQIRRRSAKTDWQAGAIHPLLRRVLENRGIGSLEELSGGLDALLPPGGLADITAAAERLREARERGERVCILGDYDTDGATAVSIAMLGLKALGFSQLDYLVPSRFDFGYGLSAPLADWLIEDRADALPHLVVTVDNGITSTAGVARLRSAGIDVIVTDHHMPGRELPDACAVVNPNRRDCDFPSKYLAGVGVCFYVLLELRRQLREAGDFGSEPEPNLAGLLDLVALGTVADLVPLDRNNRILVSHGLARMRGGACRPGIAALAQVAGRDLARLSVEDLGFALAPRLNAAGRLDDMRLGIQCLLTEDLDEAESLAAELDELNRARRNLQESMQADAQKLVDALPSTQAAAHCLYHADWHRGLTGLIASRVREKSGCPTIAFAPAGDGKLSGSGRSVHGLHMLNLLTAINAAEPGLIEKFGGHAMAAGLSIAEVDHPKFAECFAAAVAAERGDAGAEVLWSDGDLPADCYTCDCADLLDAAAPWGQHFPAPSFDDRFEVLRSDIVGREHLSMVLRHAGVKAPIKAIAFRFCEPGQPAPDWSNVELLFQLRHDRWQGRSRLQLLAEHVRPVINN